MKAIAMILMIFIPLILSSCEFVYRIAPGLYKLSSEYRELKKDFQKELDFVQSILDNPDSIVDIVKQSEYYYPGNKFTSDANLKYYGRFFKESQGEWEVKYFARTSVQDYRIKKKIVLIENAKDIHITNGIQCYSFQFILVNNELKLFLLGLMECY